jgi:CheY-like chemotaxis protein
MPFVAVNDDDRHWGAARPVTTLIVGEERRSMQADAYRVLVAEDTYPFRATIVRLLEPLGLTCVPVADGLAGAELLEDLSQTFHLAVTDFRMPRGSGWRVVEAARAHRGAAFPVIMQTAESQYPDVYERAAELSVRLIAKDDIFSLLVPAVREALRLDRD